MSWTVAICVKCWNEKNPDRKAVNLIKGPEEICVYCGMPTKSGIYTRDNPKTVPFPPKES